MGGIQIHAIKYNFFYALCKEKVKTWPIAGREPEKSGGEKTGTFRSEKNEGKAVPEE